MADISIYVNTDSVGGDGTTNATSGGTAAYSSISDCVASQDFSGTSNNYYIYCTEGASVDSEKVDFSSITLGSGSAIYICPNDSTYCTTHSLGSGASGSEYHGGDPAAGYHVEYTAYSDETIFLPSTSGLGNINIYGIVVDHYRTQGGTYGWALRANNDSSTPVMRDIIARDTTPSNKNVLGLIAGYKCKIINCLALARGYSTTYGFYWFNWTSGAVGYNLGTDGCTYGFTVDASSGTTDPILKNCYSYNHGTSGFYVASTRGWDDTNSVTCATSASSGEETWVTVTSLASSAFTDAAGDDFSLTSGGALTDAGTTVTDASPDITQTARSGTYDIGPFEYVAAGGFEAYFAVGSNVILGGSNK